MTTLQPRPPYTEAELAALYPPGLRLHFVQILLRHGERTPVSARFQNAGLAPFWPYCTAVRQLRSAVLDPDVHSTGPGAGSGTGGSSYTTLEWRRRLETFAGSGDDSPVVALGPAGEVDDVCDMGSLTDVGRASAYALGRRLRALYVDRLGFLPPAIGPPPVATIAAPSSASAAAKKALAASAISQTADTPPPTPDDFLYLRSTPVPRALESLHQAFVGLYPAWARSPGAGPPTILTRAPAEETLYPNDSMCRRFAALSRAFAQRAATRWNGSADMEYLTSKLGRWMPPDSPRVAVDSHPRLSGIMDTVNSTAAHGAATRLPPEFYDPKVKRVLERIGVEEWFGGYRESREYRALGIGGLLGDVVARMVGSAERTAADGDYELQVAGRRGQGQGSQARHLRFGMSGCHDTTLGAVLASLGAFDTDEWPPFTSHIAIEMFRRADDDGPHGGDAEAATSERLVTDSTDSGSSSPVSWIMPWLGRGKTSKLGVPPPGIGRKVTEELTATEKATLDGYYVRLRYNDEPVTIPGCRLPGNHLEGNESFCTLAAFKAIVDKFTPQDWRQECSVRNSAMFPSKPEPAGYA